MKTTRFLTSSGTLLAAGAALMLAGCAGGIPADTSAPAEDPTELVLGLVPSGDVDQLVTDGDALAALLADELGIPVTANVTDDYTALVVAMQADQAQIGMFGPIALVQAADRAGAVPILQAVRYGSEYYVTQWFTNDPDTYCLDDVVTVDTDVDGETVPMTFCNGTDAAEHGPVGQDALAAVTEDTPIAFVDPASASGYYYPATQLQEVGLDPFALSATTFAGGHTQAVQLVASGDATIGTSYNDARVDVVPDDPSIGEEVTVFAWSTDIPNDGIAVSGQLSAEWQQNISDAFLAIANTDDGLATLDAVYGIEGLVPADLDALDAARQVEANFGESE